MPIPLDHPDHARWSHKYERAPPSKRAAGQVAPGGILAWEAFTLRPQRCQAHGKPATLPPPDLHGVRQEEIEAGMARRLTARRAGGGRT
jgi:hypothetical protein